MNDRARRQLLRTLCGNSAAHREFLAAHGGPWPHDAVLVTAENITRICATRVYQLALDIDGDGAARRDRMERACGRGPLYTLGPVRVYRNRGPDMLEFFGAAPERRKLLTTAFCVASELAQLHAKGIVHGDVKPDNIVLDNELRRPCLIDFGAARFARAATDSRGWPDAIGTRDYLPGALPRDDFMFDIFALGRTMEKCAGVIPGARQWRRDDPLLVALVDSALAMRVDAATMARMIAEQLHADRASSCCACAAGRP